MASFGEAELLIAMIQAYGAPRPSSFGLGELQNDLVQAIQAVTAVGIQYVPGIGFGGFDNYSTIVSAMNALPDGGNIYLPPGGNIAVSQTVVPPAGVTLVLPGMTNDTENGSGLVPAASFTPDASNAVVHLANRGSNIYGGYVDAGTGLATAVEVDAFNNILAFTSIFGGTAESLAATSSGQRFRLIGITCDNNQNFGASGFAFTCASVDNIIFGCVMIGGSKTFGGAGLMSACHLTNSTSGSNANSIFSGAWQCSVVNFDSCGTGAPGLIQHTGSGSSPTQLDSCKFYQNGGASGVPVVNELGTNRGIQISNSIVPNPGTNAFSNLIDTPNANSMVDNVWISSTSLSGSVYGTGYPGYSEAVSINGKLQPKVRHTVVAESDVLGTNTAISGSAPTTLLTSSQTLGTGQYLVTAAVTVLMGATGVNFDLWLTTTGTMTGQTPGVVGPAVNSATAQGTFTCVVTLTVAGTISLLAQGNGQAGTALAASPVTSKAGATYLTIDPI